MLTAAKSAKDAVPEVVVLVTTRDEDEGVALARALVEKRVAACVNVIPIIQSVYEWEGKVRQGSECLMIIKSTTDVFDALETTVKSLHSYSVPEIIALPIARGSQEYLSWVRGATGRNPIGG